MGFASILVCDCANNRPLIAGSAADADGFIMARIIVGFIMNLDMPKVVAMVAIETAARSVNTDPLRPAADDAATGWPEATDTSR